MYKKLTFLLYISLAVYINLTAQNSFKNNFNVFSSLLSPEKGYVQTDREVYCVGDTIWVKGYLNNASLHQENSECNYLYIELLGDKVYRDLKSGNYKNSLEILDRKKLKKNVYGNFDGYIVVPEVVTTSKCFIRGYSYWMLNYSPEYMPIKELLITNPSKDDTYNNLVDKKVTDKTLYAKLNMLPPKDIPQPKKDYDISFLPESGIYLKDIPSNIAFKVVNEEGYGTPGEITVYNKENKIITSAIADEYGYGHILLTQPLEENDYYAIYEDTLGHNKTIHFPNASTEGVVVNMIQKIANTSNNWYTDKDQYRFLINISPIFRKDTLYINICNTSDIYYSKEIINTPTFGFTISPKQLPSGINTMVVATKSGIIATRSFFVMPQQTIDVDVNYTEELIKYGSESNAPINFATYNISLQDSINNQINGNVSLSLTNNIHTKREIHNNIISQFYLKGELHGYIENPIRFFNPNISFSQRCNDINLLMMVSGWEYYMLNDIAKGNLPMPKYGKEYIQTISGKVQGLFGVAKRSIVSFIAPSINFSAVGAIDSGYFYLRDVNFPEGTKFLVTAYGGSGSKRRTHTPILDKDNFASNFSYKKSSGKATYSQSYRNYAISNLYNTGGEPVYELDQVIVTGSVVPKKSPSPIKNYAFRRDQIRDTLDMAHRQNEDLMTYIANTFSGIRLLYTDSGRFLVGSYLSPASRMEEGEREAKAIIYLNTRYVYDIGDIESLRVGDIESVAVATGGDATAFQHNITAIGEPLPVVMILTKEEITTRQLPNITTSTPIGWQKPKKFYAPKYTPYNILQYNLNNRSTVYWNPNVEIKENKATLYLEYNKRKGVSYTCIVEGITTDGRYIYKELLIE